MTLLDERNIDRIMVARMNNKAIYNYDHSHSWFLYWYYGDLSSTKYYLSGQDIVDTLIKIRKLIYETISEV